MYGTCSSDPKPYRVPVVGDPTIDSNILQPLFTDA